MDAGILPIGSSHASSSKTVAGSLRDGKKLDSLTSNASGEDAVVLGGEETPTLKPQKDRPVHALKEHIARLVQGFAERESSRFRTVLSASVEAADALAAKEYHAPSVQKAVSCALSLYKDASETLIPEIPFEEEVVDSREFLEGFLLPNDNSPEDSARCQKLLDPLLRTSHVPGLKLKAVVLNEPGFMAFGKGGENLILSRGILDLPEEQSRAGLAHEAAHNDLRHFTAVRIAMAIQKVLIEIEGKGGKGPVKGIAQLAENSLQREQEFEADSRAVELLQGAGYGPEGLVGLLAHLQAEAPDDGNIFSDHPTMEERLRTLAASKGRDPHAEWNLVPSPHRR
ncbi:MAG: M48 family metalloprotease [Armatimonadetes bacterium]|nr:M48 family metalloprotease [Armatimonadota bacterium]